MSLITGQWYPKDSSIQYPASLRVEGANYTVDIEPNKLKDDLGITSQNTDYSDSYASNHNVAMSGHTLTGNLSGVHISDRLGNTERKLILADGSLFTTQNNDAVDALIAQNKSSNAGSKLNLLLHRHETKMTSVLIMLVFTILFATAFVVWGIPWTSQAVAHALPQKTGEYIGEQSLGFIDKYFLEPSHITKAEQRAIRARFDQRLKPFGGDDSITYKLHFRDMTINGVSLPNAFALPSGDIVLTDKFIELSTNKDEIDAVLLHEMGHVVERHSLEMLTQNSLTTVIVMLVLGNPDGISELATGLGTALVSNHYSREHETEADIFAFKKMLEIGIDPQAFINILSKMEKYSEAAIEQDEAQAEHQHDDKTANKPGAKQNETDLEHVEDRKLSDFLSTHPSTQTRIEMASKYSQCFQQGLKVCE